MFTFRNHSDRPRARWDRSHSRHLHCELLEDRRLLAVVTVDTNQDVVDFNDGVTSLREAIFATNLVGGADEIQFDFGHDGPETIVLTMGELAITDSLTITGPGAELLTIDASGNDPTPDENNGDGSCIFNIDDGSSATSIDVELRGLTLTGSDAPDKVGGAILSRENLSVTDSTVSGNSAGTGGGIFSGGTTTITGSTISGNSARLDGGGIFSGGTTTITDSTISGNSAGGGGGIWARSTMTITGSTIYDNSAINSGGGIKASGMTTISGSTISGNSAGTGGGISAFSARLTTITNSTISGNSAGKGGGIWALHTMMTITDSTISGNSARSGGGGITASRLTISGSTISGNSASSGGGISSHGRLMVTDSTISRNSADFGGGGISSYKGTTTVTGSTISDNMSGGYGGGINARRGRTTITDSTISGNSAGSDGGGISTFDSEVTITGSTISGNSAENNGGGMYLDIGIGTGTISHSTITNNVADKDNDGAGTGGGVFIAGGTVNLDHTIVAGNHDNSGVAPDIAGIVNSNFTLIGFGAEFLGPLADNSGPTQTHALLAGSPAINAGDPAFVGPPDHDQRGFPFVRVAGGRIDIGAFEVQPVPGDFNGDGNSDGFDFLAWQRGYGMSSDAQLQDGDATGDGKVDRYDLEVWEATYGTQTAVPPAPTLVVASDSPTIVRVEPRLVDLALAVGLHETDHFSLGRHLSLGHHVVGQRDAVVVDEVFQRTDFLGPPADPADRPVAKFFHPLLGSRQSTDMSQEMSDALLEAEFVAESFALL